MYLFLSLFYRWEVFAVSHSYPRGQVATNSLFFFWLHGSQARIQFSKFVGPPINLGVTCSSVTSFHPWNSWPQYPHTNPCNCFNFFFKLKFRLLMAHSFLAVAERVELPRLLHSTVFKTVAVAIFRLALPFNDWFQPIALYNAIVPYVSSERQLIPKLCLLLACE